MARYIHSMPPTTGRRIGVNIMARITKSQAQAIKAARAAHFAVGNIVFSGYWGEHSLVLAFEETDAFTWSVTVQKVELIAGQWVATGQARSHCTEPSTKDRIAEQGIAA